MRGGVAATPSAGVAPAAFTAHPVPLSRAQRARYARGWRIAAVALVVVGVWFAARFQRQLADARASAGWPSTPGTIVVSDLAAAGGRNRSSLELDVWYTYTVAGVERRGTTITLGRNRAGADWMRAQHGAFPVGRVVPVYHAPDEPGRSVLLPGLDRAGFWTLAAALLVFELAFLLPAIVFCVAAARWFERQPASDAP